MLPQLCFSLLFLFFVLFLFFFCFLFCFFFKDEIPEGLKLIESGINLRKKLGVPLYLAAGFCDLGGGYHLPLRFFIFFTHILLSVEFNVI